MEELEPHMIVAIGGFVIGLVLGATVQVTNFCTMGGISDRILMGNSDRLRAWFLATAVAMIGSQILYYMGIVDLFESVYLTPSLGWLGAIIGGLFFGFGMTKASGCGSRNATRIGSGSLKSLVVIIVLGLVGYATLRGFLGPLRLQIEATNIALGDNELQSQHIGDVLAGLTGIAAGTWRMIAAIIIPLALLFWIFKSADFRQSPRNIAGGLIIGLCVVAGWYVTGVIGADDFDPARLESVAFITPAANSVQYAMTWTGSTINFGIGLMAGVVVGAFIAAISTRTFLLEGFADTADTGRHLLGAAMMGFGGVLALGCSTGQGITGVSTLSTGSFIALISILIGGYFGIKHLEEGSVLGALKASFSRS